MHQLSHERGNRLSLDPTAGHSPVTLIGAGIRVQTETAAARCHLAPAAPFVETVSAIIPHGSWDGYEWFIALAVIPRRSVVPAPATSQPGLGATEVLFGCTGVSIVLALITLRNCGASGAPLIGQGRHGRARRSVCGRRLPPNNTRSALDGAATSGAPLPLANVPDTHRRNPRPILFLLRRFLSPSYSDV
jgi:hypothetical protein